MAPTRTARDFVPCLVVCFRPMTKTATILFTLGSVLLAACGGSTPKTQAPAATPEAQPATTAPTTPPSEIAPTVPPDDHEHAEAHEHAHGPAGDRMRPLVASALLGNLSEAGLDPKALPKIEKLTGKQRIAVMEAISEALGVECTGCHVSKEDFKTETEHKQVARHMWNDIVTAVRLDQAPLFCDSCHQGDMHVLDRSNIEAVKQYMKTQFAGRLTTTAGDEVTCAHCHGKPFEPEIFEKLWHIEED